LVIADVGGWETGDPTFEEELHPWALRAPDSVGWLGSDSLVLAAVTDAGYGLFRVSVPGPLRAGREPFARTEVEGGRSGFGSRWLVVAGGVVLALALLDSDGGDSDPGDIGDPPCPPEMDDC
jgi:hypothetical protein